MLEELDRGVTTGAPNDLESLWLPFTPNRQFKQHPRIVVAAKGVHYTSHDGRRILDSSAGLWCANLGHCHPKVVEAVQKGIATLDFAPTFQFGHRRCSSSPRAWQPRCRSISIACSFATPARKPLIQL